MYEERNVRFLRNSYLFRFVCRFTFNLHLFPLKQAILMKYDVSFIYLFLSKYSKMDQVKDAHANAHRKCLDSVKRKIDTLPHIIYDGDICLSYIMK